MPHLPVSNGCQSYRSGYSCWCNLILLLQISYDNLYSYLWHCPWQHCPNMQIKVSFHRMWAPEYVRLVLPMPFTGHANICLSDAPWCTHAPLKEFFCSVIYNVSTTLTNSSCLIALRGREERKPQVLLSLKNVTSLTKNCWVLGYWPCRFGVVYSPTRKI